MTTNRKNARPQAIVAHFDVPVNLAGGRLTRAGRTVEGECDGMRSCRGCRPLGILPRGPRTKQATLGAGDADRQGNDGPVSRRAFQEDDTLVATYHYDGLFRRTHSTVDGTDRHFLYDRAWRILEERPGSETASPDRLYTWGVRHRTDMVCRDAELAAVGGSGSSAGSSSSSSLSTQRHYVAYDWISPTVILAAANGAPVERYGYSAFGQRKVMDAGYSERGATEYEWCFAFHGQFEDVETRWMNYGFRYYSPLNGRWLRRDPLPSLLGNRYLYAGNNSPCIWDALGLLECKCCEVDCMDIQDITEKLNEHVNAKISFLEFGNSDSRGQVARGLRNRVSRDKPHPWSEGLTQIDGWIQDLGGGYRKSMGTKRGSYKYSSCVKITCNGKTRCIGADKISHFFQQGYMLHELGNQGVTNSQITLFSKASEGLVSTRPPFVGETNEDDMRWYFNPKSVYFFEGFGQQHVIHFYSIWGNLLGLGDFLARSSIEDHRSNLAGKEFWDNLASGNSKKFDICEYMRNLDDYVECRP